MTVERVEARFAALLQGPCIANNNGETMMRPVLIQAIPGDILRKDHARPDHCSIDVRWKLVLKRQIHIPVFTSINCLWLPLVDVWWREYIAHCVLVQINEELP